MQVPSLRVLLEYSCSRMERSLNEIVKFSPATFHCNVICNRKPNGCAEALLLCAVPPALFLLQNASLDSIECVTHVCPPVTAAKTQTPQTCSVELLQRIGHSKPPAQAAPGAHEI